MAKTATQRQREHVARLRRKAQAFDRLIPELRYIEKLLNADYPKLAEIVQSARSDAELAVQE